MRSTSPAKNQDHERSLPAEILRLADPGTYTSWRPMNNAGYHLGYITVDGRTAYVLATDTDHPVKNSPYPGMERLVAFLHYVADNPSPLIQLLDSPSAMQNLKGKTPIPQDAMRLLAGKSGMGGMYVALARLEGLVPRVTAIFGTLGASLSFPSTLSDALVMTENSALCIGRPDAVTDMTGQQFWKWKTWATIQPPCPTGFSIGPETSAATKRTRYIYF